MNKVKITVYTGGPDSAPLIFEFTHMLWHSSRRAVFFTCDHEPNGLTKPSEILDISEHHSYAMEYIE